MNAALDVKKTDQECFVWRFVQDFLSAFESEWVEIHALQNEIDLIIDKYQSAVDEDDKTREHIRSKH